MIGSDLFGHVAGHFTKRFFREFIGGARSAAQSRRTYRCDAPHLKRLIEMRATPLEDGRVRISHAVIEEAPIAAAVVLVETHRRALSGYLRSSLCNRLRLRSDETWREPDEALAAGGLARVVHTVCPTCRSGVEASALWARQSCAARLG